MFVALVLVGLAGLSQVFELSGNPRLQGQAGMDCGEAIFQCSGGVTNVLYVVNDTCAASCHPPLDNVMPCNVPGQQMPIGCIPDGSSSSSSSSLPAASSAGSVGCNAYSVTYDCAPQPQGTLTNGGTCPPGCESPFYNGYQNYPCGGPTVTVQCQMAGSASSADSAASASSPAPRCGDGSKNREEEECDDGNQVETDACRNNCLRPLCKANGNDCSVNGDCCSGRCAKDPAQVIDDMFEEIDTICVALVPGCGNGVVEAGEQCEPSLRGDCGPTCTFCGDGIEVAPEQCDDGNDVDEDLCSNECKDQGTYYCVYTDKGSVIGSPQCENKKICTLWGHAFPRDGDRPFCVGVEPGGDCTIEGCVEGEEYVNNQGDWDCAEWERQCEGEWVDPPFKAGADKNGNGLADATDDYDVSIGAWPGYLVPGSHLVGYTAKNDCLDVCWPSTALDIGGGGGNPGGGPGGPGGDISAPPPGPGGDDGGGPGGNISTPPPVPPTSGGNTSGTTSGGTSGAASGGNASGGNTSGNTSGGPGSSGGSNGGGSSGRSGSAASGGASNVTSNGGGSSARSVSGGSAARSSGASNAASDGAGSSGRSGSSGNASSLRSGSSVRVSSVRSGSSVRSSSLRSGSSVRSSVAGVCSSRQSTSTPAGCFLVCPLDACQPCSMVCGSASSSRGGASSAASGQSGASAASGGSGASAAGSTTSGRSSFFGYSSRSSSRQSLSSVRSISSSVASSVRASSVVSSAVACGDDAQCVSGETCVAGECSRIFCGDGLLQGNEQCEPSGAQPACAYTQGQTFCTSDCTWQLLPLCDTSSRPFGLNPFTSSRPFDLSRPPDNPFVPRTETCGDAVLDAGEECDDGNRASGDGCTAGCYLEMGRCGDGLVQTLLNEQCEPNLPSVMACRADCRYLLLSCGDGILNAGEACDLGAGNANAPGALCRADCSLPRCGDRIVDAREQCDDGNRLNGDGCDISCVPERQAGVAEVLPGMIVDLPLLAQQTQQRQTYQGQVAGTILCNAPSDCPGGSVCAAGICAVTPYRAPAGDTGPAAVVLLGAAGASAGLAWTRRRRGVA